LISRFSEKSEDDFNKIKEKLHSQDLIDVEAFVNGKLQ